MFNLDQAIAEWRQQMAAAGIKSLKVLDELESHLRDDVEMLIESGTSAREAFDSAVRRIGDARTLRVEFEKSAPQAERTTLFRTLCFSTAVALFLISMWSLIQFELSTAEKIVGFGASGLGSAYLAGVPFLRRWLSQSVFTKLMVASKIGSVFIWIPPVLLLLAATKWIHVEIGIIVHTVMWVLCLVFSFTPFAAVFGNFENGGSPILPGLSGRLSPVSQRSLEIAREEAARLGHDFVGTEHVLLGVLKLTRGALARILQTDHVRCESVQTEIERLIPRQPARISASALVLTPRARKALRFAGREAKSAKRSLINPEHIFLGLLIEGGGAAAQALKNLGVRVDRIRDALRSDLD
jgi:hypothetical protein